MEPTVISAIATGTVSLLTSVFIRIGKSTLAPGIKSASDALFETIGKKAGEQVAKLLNLVTEKFQDNPVAQTALNDFVEIPEDEDSQASFRKELKKAISSDEEFAKQLKTLLEALEDSAIYPSINISQSGSGEIATQGGTIGGSGGVTIGGSGHNIEGGIHITDQKK